MRDNTQANTPRVLVIDNDLSVRRMLGISLGIAGFAVTGVGTGEAVLQSLAQQPPEGVILDLGLPDHWARRVVQWLREQGERSTSGLAWLVTSTLDPQQVTRWYGPLDGPFFAKPFDPWDLIRTLEHLLIQSGTR